MNAAIGTLGVAAQVAKFFGSAKNAIGMGLSNNAVGVVKGLLTNPNFELKSSVVKGAVASAAIMLPTTLMNTTDFFDATKRIREIASGQSNFHISRDAASKHWGLTALGVLGSAGTAVAGLTLGAAAAPVTIAGSVLSLGALAAGKAFKWKNIDLPFNANQGLGLLSLGKPIYRNNLATSGGFLYSHKLAETAAKRAIEDAKFGKLGDGYSKTLLNVADKVSNFLMPSKSTEVLASAA